ncbi:uncharacterized protein PG986_004512 [Apiospora aurea]|uniref:Uncharacterized protein n=1 Tax=Apiospora aurea TaxID=335848 RepID=A0ABR1QMS6_9PEZI
MLFNTFAILAAAVGAAAKPLGRPVVTDAHLYAYGKDIGGLPILRLKGVSPNRDNILDNAYLVNTTVSTNPAVHNVTFSCTTENRTLQTSGPPEAENGTATNLFAFKKDTGLATFTDLEDTAATTTGFIFFGSMLFVDVDHHMQAKWVARPVEVDGQALFQIGWDSKEKDAIPIQLNTRAPMHQ